MPAEYAALGKSPQPWTVTDVIGEASLIGGIFGRGGGNELRSAQLEQAFVKRFGKRAGGRPGRTSASTNDPEAPTTITRHRAFPYETGSAFSKRGLAMPDRGSVTAAPVAPKIPGVRGGDVEPSRAPTTSPTWAPRCARRLRGPGHASNWELVAATESKHRPPDRRPRAAGRLLPAADPDGGGPPRPRDRRARRRPSPGSASTSCSATAATTRGARRRRPPTTSTPSPRSSARTRSTTATRASACRWTSAESAPTPGRRTAST